jgi:meso-butanediol dehydrogenase/(S,S)-butanediol dehydrogenase/diacetyl reductase
MQKVAVVTGGESGIGRACAVLLAQQHFAVVVGDVTLDDAANKTRFAQLGIRRLRCDVSRESDVRALLETAGPRVNVLVNSAGVTLVRQVPEVGEDEWDRVMGVNLKGVFLCCKHAIPRMVAAGGGCIVNISSNAGLLPRAHDPVYSTSKGALNALTRSLALCHAPHKIRVNAVCPGPVSGTRIMEGDLDKAPDGREAATQRFIAASPLAHAHGRMITPEEVAEAVLYLVNAPMVSNTYIAIDGAKSVGVPAKL